MNAEQFKSITGNEPENDDLERANCPEGGKLGHDNCGVCNHCGYPRFIPNFRDRMLVCNHKSTLKRSNCGLYRVDRQ